MLTGPQSWTLLGIVATMATGIIALVAVALQGYRAQLGSMKDYLEAKFEAVGTRFDGVDRRLDALDRDVQTLFRDRY